MDLNQISKKSQYFVSIDDAQIIIYNVNDKTSYVRQAKYYDENPEEIENKIVKKEPVKDNKNRNSKDKFLIIFYGTKERANSLMNDLSKTKAGKKDVIPIADSPVKSSQVYSGMNLRKRGSLTSLSQPGASSYTKRSKTLQESTLTSDNGVKNLARDFAELTKFVRTELIELKDNLNSIKADIKNFGVQLQSKRSFSVNSANPVGQLCVEQMDEQRSSPDWYSKLKEFDWESLGLTDEEATNLKYVLTEESNPSILVGSIAHTLFGDKLITHLLGKNGTRDRKAKKNDRSLILSAEEECKLRQVLGLFGSTFTNDTVWKKIVIYYVNQKGRDLKRKQDRSGDAEDNDNGGHESDTFDYGLCDNIYDQNTRSPHMTDEEKE